MWQAALLTPKDVDNTTSFMKKYGRDLSAKERVVAEYVIFCHTNSLNVSTGLKSCVGQMITNGLMASTRDTYSAYIVAKYPSAEHRHVRRACQRAHADADVEGAPRFSRQELKQRAVRIKKPLIKRMVMWLIILGLRPIAANRAMEKNVSLVTRKKIPTLSYVLVCQVPWDKTVQKRAQRQHLRLPKFMVDGLFTREELEDIFRYQGEGSAHPFENVTTEAINAAFRETTYDGEIAPTSYSPRRAYIQEAFERTGGDREKMKDMTLHFTDQVMRAHYVDWFVHTERNSQNTPEDLADDASLIEAEDDA